MPQYFTDLHIHIGATAGGQPVKMATARNLTVENILSECCCRKGIEIAGLVDCLQTGVLGDLTELVRSGRLTQLDGGGLSWRGRVTLLPGAELETKDAGGCRAHYLVFLPDLAALRDMHVFMRRQIKNIDVAAQMCRLTPEELLAAALDRGGFFLPAHVFTPFKSLYGKCADRLSDIFSPAAGAAIPAVELGLSADTALADTIGELSAYSFLANSDAHSLPIIGREYNVLELKTPTFAEVRLALERKAGRRILANYGLNPRLGKYHRTFCNDCGRVAAAAVPVRACEFCGSRNIVFGVLDRIAEIRDRPEPLHPAWRPPYRHQIPLAYIPGVGPKTIDRLLAAFGSEMAVLHEAPAEELRRVVGEKTGEMICRARAGKLGLKAGGGGTYGKVDV